MNLHSLFASLFLLLPSIAQEEVAPPAAKAVAPGVTVTLAFQGGTLGDFVDQVRRVQPRANIVMAAGAANARLPEMDLRGAGLDQALESACMVAESDQQIRIKEFRGSGEPVFTILLQARSQGPEAMRVSVRTQVFGLARLTDMEHGHQLAPATVLSAIEAALGEGILEALRYHKESGLMIVRGNGEQLEVVQSVLQNLERDLHERRNRAQQQAERAAPAGGTGGPSPNDKK